MHKLQNGQVSTLGFAVRTEIWTSWWPRHWTPTQGTSCALSLQQNYRLSSLGLICATGAVTGHCFWHKAHCHSCHSWPRLIAAPSSALSPNLETPPSNIQGLKESKVCPTLLSTIFAATQSKGCWGEVEGTSGGKVWPLSQGPAGRQVGRTRAEVVKGRSRDGCTPREHTSPTPLLRGTDKMDVNR